MQFAPDRVTHVIKLFGHEDALVTRERRRFRKVGMIDTVRRAPRTVHPMCPGLEDVVLEIVFVEQHQSALVAEVGELFQS